MTSSSFVTPRGLRRAWLLLGILLAPLAALAADRNATASFDVPAGDAAVTLKQFAEQSGQAVVYMVDAVRGVPTNAVKGRLAPLDALERLLAGSKLHAVADAKTGALSVTANAKNDSRAAQPESDRPSNRPKVEDGTLELEDYTVHGVRMPGQVNQGVIARVANGAVAFQIYDRTAIENTGANSLGEFFRNYSGNTSQGLGFQSVFGGSPNLANGPGDTGDRINLRGLGNNRTVVLLNGRRLYGSDSQGPDVSRIPLSAVERIEILPGAGAAIYGANAVGGAVNIITRRNHNILEFTGYFGTSTGGGATEYRGTLYYGFSVGDGRTTGSLIVEHLDRGELRARDREFYLDSLNVIPTSHARYATLNGSALRTPRARITTTSPLGLMLPGNPTATVTYVPTGYNNAAPAANDFAAGAGQTLISTNRPGAVLLQPAAVIDSVNFQGEHSFRKDRLEAYTELAWRYQQGHNTLPGIGGNASLTATSPLNPFRADIPAGRPVGVPISIIWDPVDVPLDVSATMQRTLRLVGGLKGKLGGAWAVDYSYDRNESYSTYLQYYSSLNDAVTAGIYNPFRDLAQFPNTINLPQLTTTNINRNLPEIHVGNVRASGELPWWRDEPLKISVGAELRREDIKGVGVVDYSPIRRQVNPASVQILGPTSNGESKGARKAQAAYAELTVPLIGKTQGIPLAETVELALAARHESYGSYSYRSTFGAGVQSGVSQPDSIQDTPLTAAILWRPVRDVSFRASYSGTFVSPTMSQFFSARTTIPNASPTSFFDPVLNAAVTRPAGSVTITSGGNPALLPESGRAYNYGIVITPRWAPGLTLTADLFHVVSDNQIRTPNVQTVISFYPSRVTRDAANNVIAYDTSSINMSQVIVGGADFRLSYDFNVAGLGDFNWQAGATYTDYYKQKAVIGDPFLKGVGDRTLDFNVPLRLKGSTSLNFTRGNWGVGFTARYIGRFKDSFNTGVAIPVAVYPDIAGIDGESIRSQLECDLRCTYEFTEGEAAGWRSMLRGTKVALGVLNLFDRRPPYLSSFTGGANYSYYNDPRMRFVYLELKKKF